MKIRDSDEIVLSTKIMNPICCTYSYSTTIYFIRKIHANRDKKSFININRKHN
jgi:hypothetical protein